MPHVTRKFLVPLLTLAATLMVYYADAAYVTRFEPGPGGSALFSQQLDSKLAELRGAPLSVTEETSQPVQLAILGPSGGVSGCAFSGCLASGCGGSACAGSGCVGSACGGSACGGSGCGGSVCSGSGCTGSVCNGSGCVGSACLGSGCVGSVCGRCLNAPGPGSPGQPAAAHASCPLIPGAVSPGRIVGLQVEPVHGGQQVSWIASGVEVESYRLVRIPADATQAPEIVSRGAAAAERMMSVADLAGEAGGSYRLELTDVAGRKLVATTSSAS